MEEKLAIEEDFASELKLKLSDADSSRKALEERVGMLKTKMNVA